MTVTAKITATGTTNITHYALSESDSTPAGDSSLWNSIATPSTTITVETGFALSPSAGDRTVYGWVKNEAGQVSASFSATITMTLPAPAPGAASSLTAGLTINSGAAFTNSRTVSLSLSGLGSATINGYEVSEGSTPSNYTSISSPSSSFQLSPFTFDLSGITRPPVQMDPRLSPGVKVGISD